MIKTIPGKKQFWLILLIGIALVVRLGYMVAFGGFEESLRDSNQEQNIYLDIAYNLSNKNSFTTSTDIWVSTAGKPTSIVAPVYPVFLAVCFKVFGASLIPVRIIQILLSLLLVVAVYFIGKLVFNHKTGVLAGLVTAIYPAFIMYTRPILPEGIYYPALALLIWLTALIVKDSSSKLRYITWGLLSGFIVMTRSDSFLLVIFIFLFVLFNHLKSKSFDLKLFGLPVAVFIIILIPFTLYNIISQGNYSPFPNNRWVFWESTSLAEMKESTGVLDTAFPEKQVLSGWAGLSEIERDTALFNKGIQFVTEKPQTYVLQRLKMLSWAYPILLVEFNKTDEPIIFRHGPTSLDEQVTYTTPVEKLRLWTFRLICLSGSAGVVLAIWQKRKETYWLIPLLIWPVILAFGSNVSERERLQVDSYIILFTSFFVTWLFSHKISLVSIRKKTTTLRRGTHAKES